MVVNCSSRVARESERIAWICAEQLWLHREMLMAAGFFEIGRQPAIGAPSPAGSIVQADAGEEWYVTPVTCPFQLYRTSQYSPLGKRIVREMGLSIRARLDAVNQQNVNSNGHGGPVATTLPGFPYEVDAQRPPAYAPAASDVYGGPPVPGEVAPVLRTVPHPHNPARIVTIRGSRPNSPAVRPASMGGRPIPLAPAPVEQSPGNQMGPSAVCTRTKV
jgi:hypothetical protein